MGEFWPTNHRAYAANVHSPKINCFGRPYLYLWECCPLKYLHIFHTLCFWFICISSVHLKIDIASLCSIWKMFYKMILSNRRLLVKISVDCKALHSWNRRSSDKIYSKLQKKQHQPLLKARLSTVRG